ncbi:MAG: tetraacyldisaccharide 4'-kinase [Bacteroidota bacterium]
MKHLLLPLSWFYGLVVWLRNRMFDLGILRTSRVSVPVISVGNLTAGGTGKTPLVEAIAGHLLSGGKKVGIVSRGYGRASRGVVVVSDGNSVRAAGREAGDEPMQMAWKHPSAAVVVGERRVEAARRAVALGAEVLVLDDAFQHRYLHRDVNIVVLDSRIDITRERLLPSGLRRELLPGLGRADILVLSRVPPHGAKIEWAGALAQWYNGPIVRVSTRIDGFFSATDGTEVAIDRLKRERIYAFSGIAQHGTFVEDLSRSGLDVRAGRAFPDHHVYTGADIESIEREVGAAGCSALMTTEKDIARIAVDEELGGKFLERLPVYHTRVSVGPVAGGETLWDLIDAAVLRGTR